MSNVKEIAGVALELGVLATTMARAFGEFQQANPAMTLDEAAAAYGRAVAGSAAAEDEFDAALTAWKAQHG